MIEEKKLDDFLPNKNGSYYKEFEFKNERNMLLKYKNRPIYYNSKKYNNSFKMSQKHFYLELIKSLNNKNSNICDAKEALETFKLIFLILKGHKK